MADLLDQLVIGDPYWLAHTSHITNPGPVPPTLADFECGHGRIPGDRTPPCGCWPQEAAPAHVQRLERFRRQAAEQPLAPLPQAMPEAA